MFGMSGSIYLLFQSNHNQLRASAAGQRGKERKTNENENTHTNPHLRGTELLTTKSKQTRHSTTNKRWSQPSCINQIQKTNCVRSLRFILHTLEIITNL